MSEPPASRFDQLSKCLYRDAIDEYAHGQEEMETHALAVCLPATAALTEAEEYASIVLTSRMNKELETLIEHGGQRPGRTFFANIELAHRERFITNKMHKALHLAREIRNCYAHQEDPDRVRRGNEYQGFKEGLLSIDFEHTEYCVHRMNAAKRPDGEFQTALTSEVVAVMVWMCENLGNAASCAGPFCRPAECRVIPAFFGFDDALAIDI
jgi:hypothetical protein